MIESKHQSLERIHGSVERVTFHSEETGFCVLRTKVKGHRDLITVIGTAANVATGEYIECEGFWVNDKNHGLQFKARQLNITQPTTLEGMQKYLSSGMIKGIGSYLASKLIQAFGETVFDIIENNPERLTELEGIGTKRKEMIIDSWTEQKVIRDIMVFLQSHGVGTARAVRIYKTYGGNAIDTVRENPYRLSLDIRGIGFKTADLLAERLGIARESILRAQAGVRHVLQELCDRGHCAIEYDQLVKTSISLLEITELTIRESIQKEIDAKNLVSEDIYNTTCIFPAYLHHAESKAAEHLLRIRSGYPPWGKIDIVKAIPWVERQTGIQLSDSQKRAVETVLQNKLSIITGGPGVGKTTIVNSLIKIVRAKRLSIALCAPTGRAAKRLTETTGITAKTIHRLLEFNPQTFSFKHNQDNPLPIDFLVVDESVPQQAA